jgi:hypothetical protein
MWAPASDGHFHYFRELFGSIRSVRDVLGTSALYLVTRIPVRNMKDCLEDLGVHLRVDVRSALGELRRWADTRGRKRTKKQEYCASPRVFVKILRILRDALSGDPAVLQQIRNSLESQTLLWLPQTYPFDPEAEQVWEKSSWKRKNGLD